MVVGVDQAPLQRTVPPRTVRRHEPELTAARQLESQARAAHAGVLGQRAENRGGDVIDATSLPQPTI